MADERPNALAAALDVLRAASEPLHWTVIQDRALRAGGLDPFVTPNVRRELLGALRTGVRNGTLRDVGGGVYAVVETPPD